MSNPSLGGAQFIYNAIECDYPVIESINALKDCCDQVVVVDAGSTDGTQDLLATINAGNCSVLYLDEWDKHQGRQKLSYFTNRAIELLNTDWFISIQADEILSECSFDNIRAAIEHATVDSYVCKRWNLWRDPLSMLQLEQHRKPCSDEVIRLCRSYGRAYDDAEQIAAKNTHVFGQPEAIQIFHVGYIRNPVKHVIKARRMLVDVFGLGMDSRIGEIFDYSKFPFTGDDIVPVPGPLPVYIREWACERYPNLREQIMQQPALE